MDTTARTVPNSLVLDPSRTFNGVKIFSATMLADRDRLGEKVTAWIADHPQCSVVEVQLTQSSDDKFHCVAFSVFYREALPPRH